MITAMNSIWPSPKVNDKVVPIRAGITISNPNKRKMTEMELELIADAEEVATFYDLMIRSLVKKGYSKNEAIQLVSNIKVEQ